ncbi:MAG: HD domain-containing protein [Candidatus Eremiobacteraeota bacterium]|nr:HD domain-containing protein [Candidatus Eremiobacteraeota bacterium]MCW5866034.1 HD domain-containing protein [Candidatus Eremiobacteraeota bacterium]
MNKRGSHWEPAHRASVRHRVAVEAARLLYHREYREYFQAKRVAAKRQGTLHLPSNREIHEQLLHIARRLEGEEHAARLESMRRCALEVMERVPDMQPRLIGSVWTGHIRQGSDIDINLYCDEVEQVVEALAEWAPEVVVVRAKEAEFIHVQLADVGGYACEVTVYDWEHRFEQPRCGITGGPMRRGTLAELRGLLSQRERPAGQDWRTLAQWSLPALEACRGVLQNGFHHLDVYDHTLAAVAGIEAMATDGFTRFPLWQEQLRTCVDVPLLRLAAFCHDLGKPATQSFTRDGRIRFLGHEEVSAQRAAEIAYQLGLGGQERKELVALVAQHMEPVLIPHDHGLPSRIHALFVKQGRRLPELALLSLADVEAARGPAQTLLRLEEQKEFVDFLLQQYFEQGFLANPCLPVSREELLEQFGVLDERTLRRILDALLADFVDGEFESQEEGLSLASEYLADPRHR